MRALTLLAAAAVAALPALAQQPAAPASGAEQQGAAPADQPEGEAQASEGSAGGEAPSGPLEFRTIIGDKPIEIADEDLTTAFEEFRETGVNPFAEDEAAIAEGKALYAKLCQACHLPTGEGRIGPSLRDDAWRHPSLETEAGRFAIIHSGGAGAMQAFHRRMDLDEILKVMAYTDTFRGG